MTASIVPTADLQAVQLIPVAQLRESEWNPRKTFNQVKLQELADSFARSGQITPCVVRKNGKGYELAAGHRRFRAAKLAGLEALLCIVRVMDDATFLEVLLIENADREDVHPLEEAQGFRTLMVQAGYDVAKLAARVGRQPSYVYDRLKLLQLIPEAQELFLADRFTLGHAIILARLTADQQRVALDLDSEGHERWGRNTGLFRRELGIFSPLDDDDGDPDEEAEPDVEDRRTPVSVAEFQAWVDGTFRLDDRNEDLPMVFPETAQKLERAHAQVAKVVHITYTHAVPPDVNAEGEKIIGPMSWKRADGQRGSEVCDHAALGLIVFGGGRGESFDVCVAKKKCPLHWPEHHRGKGKKSAKAGKQEESWQEKQRRESERWERERKEKEAVQARWVKAAPQIAAALTAKVEKLSAKGNGLLADLVLDGLKENGQRWTGKIPLARGSSAEDFLRYAALWVLLQELVEWNAPQDFPKRAKALGIDLTRILNDAAPVEQPKAEKKPKAKKGKAK